MQSYRSSKEGVSLAG